ncbi:MAG: glycosyltransferase [Myxococcota bacterium]
MEIVVVGPADVGGGAEAVARALRTAWDEAGATVRCVVGRRATTDEGVIVLPHANHRGAVARATLAAGGWAGRRLGLADDDVGRLAKLAEPLRVAESLAGHEDFNHPGTAHLLELLPARPDVLHLHNLHGGYFDLRALPRLSRALPTFLTLHDPWLMTGHCAHPVTCERWRTGCGSCPDLQAYPSIRRDATAYNWRRKEAIYRRSRLYVGAPSRWILGMVQDSMLRHGVVETRHIPHGVDLQTFHARTRAEARRALSVDDADLVVTLDVDRRKAFRSTALAWDALHEVATRHPARRMVVLAMGEDGPVAENGRAQFRHVGRLRSPAEVARCYQAADVLLHLTRADTFPNSVMEAMACGCVVVASSVGGIPEQLQHGVHGILVPPARTAPVVEALDALLLDPTRRDRLARAAAAHARAAFDLHATADAYLRWFEEVVEARA